MAISENTLADDICQHVGCFNIGSWLYDLATQLQVGAEELMPVPPQREHCLDIPQLGLRLTLKHPHAGHVNVGDPARWILTGADFSLQRKNAPDQREAVPFGIDPVYEVPDSIGSKFGDHQTTPLDERAIAAGDRRQSYFLTDGRVVGITWSEGLAGVELIAVVRLGIALDFERQLKVP